MGKVGLIGVSLIGIACGGASADDLFADGAERSPGGGVAGGEIARGSGGGDVGGSESVKGGEGHSVGGGASGAPRGGSTMATAGRRAESGRSGGGSSGSSPVAAGSMNTASGTAGDTDGNSRCTEPYAELPAGPRETGPENPGVPCDELSDESILESYAVRDRRTLRTYYYDPAEVVIWGDRCSDDSWSAEAWAGETSGLEEPEATYTTDYFYEVAYCSAERATRVRYRWLRCDYFDGYFFWGPAPSNRDAPGFLGSLLWFTEQRGLEGSQLISVRNVPGDVSDTAELCTIRTTYGDFGLCDEITLESWLISIGEEYDVTRSGPSVVRTLTGKCR